MNVSKAAAHRAASSSSMQPMLGITDLAHQARTTVRALRYYEEIGLLTPLRSGGNARFYPPLAARTACLIADLRRSGVTVPEIAALLAELEGGRSETVVALIGDRLVQIEQQRETLTALLRRITTAPELGRGMPAAIVAYR